MNTSRLAIHDVGSTRIISCHDDALTAASKGLASSSFPNLAFLSSWKHDKHSNNSRCNQRFEKMAIPFRVMGVHHGLPAIHRTRSECLWGEPVIKGTSVTVRTILASLAEGAHVRDILEDFPTLKEDDIRAVITFAATSAEEDTPIPAIPAIA